MKPLLALIDDLTNWYIRFNRLRLKGRDGVEETLAALNSLFETLLTLCRTMVSLGGYSYSPIIALTLPTRHLSRPSWQRTSTNHSENICQPKLLV